MIDVGRRLTWGDGPDEKETNEHSALLKSSEDCCCNIGAM